MSVARPITSDEALAIARARLSRETQFSMPSGANLDGIIYCNSGLVVFDLRKELGDAAIFYAAFDSEISRMKDEMTDALSESVFTKPIQVLGFQFRAHLSDENGAWSVDLMSAFCVSLSARLYARG